MSRKTPSAPCWRKAECPRLLASYRPQLPENTRAERLHGYIPFNILLDQRAMTLDITLSLIAIFALLIFAAFFAGAETALTAVSKARMYHLASEGSTRAKQVLYLIGNRERLIGALLLGNTFVNILASSLATLIAISLFDEGAVVIAAVV